MPLYAVFNPGLINYVQSISYPTGLLDIFIDFIFDIMLCFGGISLMRTFCDACYEEHESH